MFLCLDLQLAATSNANLSVIKLQPLISYWENSQNAGGKFYLQSSVY